MGLKMPYFHQESFDLSDDTPTEPTTPLFRRVACGLGHVFNDVIRQLFFSFRLVYFMNILGLSASLSGWLLLEKPLVHIVLSHVCAILVDRVSIPFVSRKIGNKKSWHLLGTILEAVFIPFFFTTHYLIQSEDSKTELMMIHLGILNVILGFGDGLLEISHLSLITLIATDQMEAVEMNSTRTAFTYLSGILTFVVAWVIFGLDPESQLSESSSKDFVVLTEILVAVGILSSLIFYLGVKEPNSRPQMPLRKSSTFAATNSERPTNFILCGDLGETMPSLAKGLSTARKASCPTRIVTCANFCDETQRTLTECNMNEEKMPQGEKEPPKQNLQSWGSALSNDLNSTGVVNRGFSVSVLDLYSDDAASNHTSCVSKEPALTNESAVSQETKNDPLLETKANSQLVANAESNTAKKKIRPPRKVALVTLRDEILSAPSKDDTNKRQTLPNQGEAPIDNLQSRSSSLSNDPNSTGVVNKVRCVSVLEWYSNDKESNGTSRVSKESAPIDLSATSLDTKSVSFAEIKADRKPVVKLDNTESDLPRSTRANKTVRGWLIDPRLHLVTVAYSCTWTLQIHGYSYLPLFLIYRLRLSKESIAYLPLILTISAAVSSSLSKKFVQKIGEKLCFIIAAIFVFIAGVMSYFMEAESWTSKVMIYPAVILLGFGFSSMFVTSLSLAAELIGENTKTSGFVFAFMTVAAAISNGSVLMIIQELFPEQRVTDCEECGDYLRLVFSLVNVSVAIFSVVTVLLLYCINRFDGKSPSSNEDSETST